MLIGISTLCNVLLVMWRLTVGWLQVIAVVGSAAAAQHDDSHAVQVASEALAAVVPAWLSAGRAPADLVETLVATLPQTAAHRRLPLLSAVLRGLPEVWKCEGIV